METQKSQKLAWMAWVQVEVASRLEADADNAKQPIQTQSYGGKLLQTWEAILKEASATSTNTLSSEEMAKTKDRSAGRRNLIRKMALAYEYV